MSVAGMLAEVLFVIIFSTKISVQPDASVLVRIRLKSTKVTF